MNDELKQELEDVVDGLTDYLRKVQEQQAQQQREADALKKERDQLIQRLREAEAEKQQVPVDEIEAVQRVSLLFLCVCVSRLVSGGHVPSL